MLSSGCAPEMRNTPLVPLLDASWSEERHVYQFLINPASTTFLALLPADVLRVRKHLTYSHTHTRVLSAAADGQVLHVAWAACSSHWQGRRLGS